MIRKDIKFQYVSIVTVILDPLNWMFCVKKSAFILLPHTGHHTSFKFNPSDAITISCNTYQVLFSNAVPEITNIVTSAQQSPSPIQGIGHG